MSDAITQELMDQIDDLLGEFDVSNVTSEDNERQRDELPDGYYNSELESAEITQSKTSKQPMIALRFKVAENGIEVKKGDNYETALREIPDTKGRKFGIYYVLKDEKSLKRAVSDLLKFEDGEGPLLDPSFFTDFETLNQALGAIIGTRIYVMVSTTTRDDKTNTWRNLVSWTRVKELNLPR